MVEGIRLGLDSDGNSCIIEDSESHKCLADTNCVYAQRDGASITCEGENVFDLERCPRKKWHIYLNVRSEFIIKSGCFCCGSIKQWRIKNGPWVCENCHPPPFKKEKYETRTSPV
jgi:hypothetical protein